MSVGSLGTIGSVASGQLQQIRGADSDRALHDARIHSRELDAARQAEAAEGIGQMLQDEGTSDRDADGRRLWERTVQRPREQEDADVPVPNSAPSLDPTGESGGHLDLTG